jgi:hypothetical protein
MSTEKHQSKPVLIEQCLEFVEYETELGDGTREDLSKPQLVAVLDAIVVATDTLGADHEMQSIFERCTKRQLRQLIADCCGFAYLDDGTRQGSEWFRRDEIVQVLETLQEQGDEP